MVKLIALDNEFKVTFKEFLKEFLKELFMISLPDFEKIDKKFEFHFYDSQITLANSMGFKYISEGYYKLRFDSGMSFRKISGLFGLASQTSLIYFFKKQGWSLNLQSKLPDNHD